LQAKNIRIVPREKAMALGNVLGRYARRLDRELGLQAWLRGEPRPPRGGFDLAGEKIIDWGWICVNLPVGPKRGLEIGCGESPILPGMLTRGYDVTCVDLNDTITTELQGFRFIRGDFNQIELLPGFDVIVACSAIEHFGLAGRYGSKADPDADIKGMTKIRSLLSSRGQAFITVPIGSDALHNPWHRVYGKERLPLLLNGFTVQESRFWTKRPWGPWHETTLVHALDHPVDLRRYALGQFVLVKND
jgi:hypothetical protein